MTRRRQCTDAHQKSGLFDTGRDIGQGLSVRHAEWFLRLVQAKAYLRRRTSTHDVLYAADHSNGLARPYVLTFGQQPSQLPQFTIALKHAERDVKIP